MAQRGELSWKQKETSTKHLIGSLKTLMAAPTPLLLRRLLLLLLLLLLR